MKIIWNGDEISYKPGVEKTIMDRLKKENLVISSIKINDVDLVNATLEDALAKPVPGRVVHLTTRPAEDLLQESLADATAYLPRLRGGIRAMREALLDGNEEGFRGMVEAALEGLEWLGLTLQAYFSQKHPSVEMERLFTLEYARLHSVLKELETGLTEGMGERVCDLFEKDITEFLDKMLFLTEELNRKNNL